MACADRKAKTYEENDFGDMVSKYFYVRYEDS